MRLWELGYIRQLNFVGRCPWSENEYTVERMASKFVKKNFRVYVEWLKGNTVELVVHLGIGMLSFEYSVGLAFLSCGGSVGRFGGENRL